MPPLRAAHPAGLAMERRRLLRLSAASLALSLAGCDDGASSDGNFVPAVVQPADIVPGIANHYATASLGPGGALGIVVTHQMGRPIKVEGNPHHPASLGATDPFAQAMLLDFYDPGRAASATRRGVPASWSALLTDLADRRVGWATHGGAGLRILTGRVASPTMGRLLDGLLAQYPGAVWHRWESVPRGGEGAALAYGRAVDIVPRPAAADVIAVFDSDLIDSAPGHVAHARAFASRRNPVQAKMSRVYAVEPTPTLIGVKADHRIAAEPAQVVAMLAGLASALGAGGAPADPRLAAMVEDLRAHRGAALVHAGAALPPAAQALAHAANEALGGRGRTFDVIEPVSHRPGGPGLAELEADIASGVVTDLIVIDENPAYGAPGFEAALRRVPFSLVLAPTLDETGQAATWFVPQTHAFEAWGDVRAFDGTATILQPQALPLRGGASPLTLLSLLAGPDAKSSRDLVRATWSLSEPAWRDAVARGIVPNSQAGKADAAIRAGLSAPPLSGGLAVLCRPDPHVWDGRWTDNAWLQELPRPLTKLVWDNPLLVSPELAAREKLVNGAEIRLKAGAAEVVAPVWIVPGQAAETVVALRGFGRRVVGDVGAGAGWDVTPLLAATGPVSLVATGNQVALASTDHHDVMRASPDGIVRQMQLEDVAVARAPGPEGVTLYAPTAGERAPARPAWGMSIDLNACIGCNACVVACQAENNVPVVGKNAVMQEREMHWLRIDRYYDGATTLFEPMLCQHCEEAPCEVVCPVEATVHDSEGLNVMVYNRCVGTRFCSNNCPYKVRRFNYGAYAREEASRPDIARNPDVSVRGRGVMEKCTFCVQRIAAARIASDIGNRPIADGEVVTACQAACPTQAYSFGDVRDPDSAVAARKHSPLTFVVLEDQATHPRVTYEAVVRNPNPAMPA